MDSTPKLLGFLLMLWITASAKALPTLSSKNEVSSSRNIVGIASQIITKALIQGQADSSSNYVFSPIGYATILSILGHGSVGQTRKEIFQVLGQPDNTDEVRNAYQLALTEYSGNDSVIAPQFKTWFYIYRNNTAEEAFKKILSEYYLVEIKDIDRFSYDFDTPRTAEEQKSEANLEKLPTNGKDVNQFEDLKNTEPTDEMGSIDGFEGLKLVDEYPPSIQQAVTDYEQLNENEKNKVSKFDKHVDDMQYLEVPEIKERKNSSENENIKKKLQKKSEGPEKISLPLKKYMENSAEIMDAQETRHFVNRVGDARAQPLHHKEDVTSALSGNSIVGRKGGASSESENQLESKMLLFNGLYFRGNWAQPFMELRSDEIKYFNAVSGKQEVKFMMTHGTFKYTEVRSRNLIAVELPYKNERYSMMIILPDSEKDLRQFSRESNYNSLNEIISRLEPTSVQLFLPKFRFECTSRAEKALGKLGLTTLFTSKADLTGITKDAKNYQIEELVQHVAIRVDEGSSSENALSAGNIESRRNGNSNEIKVDKPFLFYVRDVVEDIILAAGKIMEIPVEQEVSLNFDSKNN